jgi:hypothetical protein
MVSTPNAPPPRPPGQPAPRVRLFGATAIALHAVLFPPPFGSLLAAENYRRLGDASGLRRALVLYVLPSVGLLFFSIAAASRGQKTLVVGAIVGMAYALFRDQHPVVQRHLAAGGSKARWYLASLLWLLVSILLLAVWQILDPSSPSRGR